MNDINVQCTRCRNKHLESERVSVPNKTDTSGLVASDLVCPRCGCRSFYDLTPQVAWCWSSGLIETGDVLPADSPDGGGPILIASGPKAYLRGVLYGVARLSRGKGAGQLLVPGVPEADDATASVDALIAWHRQCAKGNGSKHRSGVTFTMAGNT